MVLAIDQAYKYLAKYELPIFWTTKHSFVYSGLLYTDCPVYEATQWVLTNAAINYTLTPIEYYFGYLSQTLDSIGQRENFDHEK